MISAADLLAKVPRGLDFDTARQEILATCPALPSENFALADALGRTLATPIIAARANPAAHISAMDGYAVRAKELAAGPLTLMGETPAGVQGGTLPPKAAQRVFTGSVLPVGADTVLIQEEALVSDGSLSASSSSKKGAFVRPKGFDFDAGQELLAAGTLLTPSRLALVAAGNWGQVPVVRRPKIGILSTGRELVAPGTASAAEHVPASNGLALAAFLRQGGAEAMDLGFQTDEVAALAADLKAALPACDLLITTGGASVGDHDLVQDALASLGGRPVFWQIKMRPGKPVFLWHLENTPVLGLPGNPVSALVGARLLVQPWVRKALGQTPLFDGAVTLNLGVPLAANGPRRQFARARLHNGLVFPVPSQDSSLLRSLDQADLLIDRPALDQEKAAGEQIQAIHL